MELAELNDKETALKWKYAEELLRNPDNPFAAAMIVTHNNRQAAMLMLDQWTYAGDVAQMKEHLLTENGEEHYLPSEAQMVGEVIARARKCHDDSDYVKLMALAFDVRGMNSKAKAGPSVVVNNQTNNRIMQIPVMLGPAGTIASDDEWERGLMEQQQRLVENVPT